MHLNARHPLQVVLGFTVWSAWFVLVYGGTALACAAGPSVAAIHAGLLAVTAVVAAGLVWASRRCARAARTAAPGSADHFTARTGAVLHTVAALSTAFVGLPILLVPACA